MHPGDIVDWAASVNVHNHGAKTKQNERQLMLVTGKFELFEWSLEEQGSNDRTEV